MAYRVPGIARVAALAAICSFSAAASAKQAEPLVVHEWGTFTSLQDENGEAIGGINVDDEPLPGFVHRIANYLMLRPGVVQPAHLALLSKGAPHCHPHVTMRLETPVVYFHPPKSASLPLEVDVEVEFRGGWLSEYYPNAKVEAPGVNGHRSFGPITSDTVGSLHWKNLQVGTEAIGPETSSRVWLAPREVNAANVTTAGGESERYLFYRGVGHVESPLRVARDTNSQSLVLTANFPAAVTKQPVTYVVPKMWLVKIRDDGTSAFREIDGFEVAGDGQPHVVARMPAEFAASDFDTGSIRQLTSAMRAALIDDGLYADEADALLGTWKLSYFETPGLRLFYLLPRAWTDHVLPMRLSSAARLVRTMVGRVEIVTPGQRELLRQIAAAPIADAESLTKSMHHVWAQQGPEPAYVQAYRRLGRFGNALVLDELRRRPTPALESFVDGYGLRSYTPSNLESASASAAE